MTKNKYLLVTNHLADDCLEALDTLAAHDPTLLDQAWLGCLEGEHTGWLIVEAADELHAKRQLPEGWRAGCKVIPVDHLTPQKIRTLHGVQPMHPMQPRI